MKTMLLLIPIALLMQMEIALGEPCSASQNVSDLEKSKCGKLLAPFCRNFHSIRRINDNSYLVTGGHYSSGATTCNSFVYDAAKKTISDLTLFPGDLYAKETIGFKLPDDSLGVTNRNITIDPNGPGGTDFIFSWDQSKKSWKTYESIASTELASTPLILRKSSATSAPSSLQKQDPSALIFFTGEFIDEHSDGDTHLHKIVQINQIL